MKIQHNKSNTLTRRTFCSVLGCCMAAFWAGAISFGYPGVMTSEWQARFGVGEGETGLVVSIMLLGISVCTFASGQVFARYGMRRCIIIGTALMLAAMAVLLLGDGMLSVYVWAFVVEVGVSFMYGPGLTTVQEWMPNRKGIASGLMNLSFGLSAAIMSPVWQSMLETVGYRALNIILTVCFLVTNAVAALLAEAPEKLRLTKEEYDALDMKAATGASKKGCTAPLNLTPREAVKTKEFWLLWLSWAFMGAAGISMVSMSKGYAVSRGLSSVAVLTAFNVTNGVSRLIAGILCEALGGIATALIGFSVSALGYILMPHMGSLAGACAAAACVGYGFGTLFTITGPVATGLFGVKNFGSIFGLIFTAYGCVGGFVGPWFGGILLESSGGNYSPVFIYLSALVFAGIIVMLLLMRRARRRVTLSFNVKSKDTE